MHCSTAKSSQAPSFSTVGENSGVSIPPSPGSFSQVVGLWFDGRHLYNCTSGMCFRDQFCDPYTQLVWATSNQVGCGATRCNPLEGFPVGEGLLIVCNYGPAGNLEGQSSYMTGASSCSNCPDDKKSCVNNLYSDDCNADKVTIVDVSVAGRRYHFTVQVACPGQTFRDGPRKRAHFSV